MIPLVLRKWPKQLIRGKCLPIIFKKIHLHSILLTFPFRYSNLNNGVINRGKQLHAAVHSLQSFDRAMDQFLAFLSESESMCESAESEIERNPLMLKVSSGYKFIIRLYY